VVLHHHESHLALHRGQQAQTMQLVLRLAPLAIPARRRRHRGRAESLLDAISNR